MVRSLAQVARPTLSRVLRPLTRLLAERRSRSDARVHARELSGLRASIDWNALDALRARYPEVGPGHKGPLKYFDVEGWLPHNLRRALERGLHRGGPRRVLDLGSGFGYFLLCCSHFGHDAQGLDFVEQDDPEASCYGAAIELFGQRRVLHRIAPFVPLPQLGPAFDLVCAYDICFNRKPDGTMWGVPEWDHFLGELSTRLRSGGEIHLEFNLRTDGPGFHAHALEVFFREAGARLSGSGRTVHFDSSGLRLP